ncbi:TetR/AcrR family transcriptional regulator [Companilactobacillus furfuricola]|uniref:TetR/AcrR family transcriptional regulator n=1 Tax=Companilactobacillus furfuricola TaxID=1462575 RepID=UPI000F79CCA8|nr:TetR/AcrR family transcriptional regulator [Companilactobacillus furfuricola]
MTDMRKTRTNREIFSAFGTLLSNKPFSEITMIEIAREAQVHRNTIYKHFVDKYDLLRKFVYSELGSNEELIKIFVETPFKAIAELYQYEFSSIIQRQKSDPEFNLIVQESAVRLLYQRNEDDDILWQLGTISSIFLWNELHGDKFDFLADYKVLDQIYQKREFPKLEQ